VQSRIVAVLLFTVALGSACASAPNRPVDEPGSSGHGYALLYEILGQERQVSKLLLIKIERDELETVIDSIDTTCDTAYARLGELALQSPQIDLADTGLPADEVRTRRAIAATRREQLLAASGREFERQYLSTQREALTYASRLADTLARREPDPARLAFTRGLWKDLTRLLQDVEDLQRRPARLRSNPRSYWFGFHGSDDSDR
jgi:hypothetical protein